MILRCAGQEALGGYAIVMQVMGYGILLDFGFNVSMTRYLCQSFGQDQSVERFREILTVGRNILFITNFLFSGMLLAVAWQADFLTKTQGSLLVDTRIALILMAVWMVARTPIYIYNTALTATQDLATLNIMCVAGSGIRLVVAFVLTYLGFGLPGIVVATVISELMTALIQQWYFKKHYQFYMPAWSRGNLALGKDMFRFGFQYWGVNLGGIFLLSTDNLIVSAIFGASITSIFYSTKMLGSMILTFMTRIIDHIYPGLNELIGKNDMASVRNVYLRTLRYVLLLALPAILGIVFFAERLVTVWIGRDQFAGTVMSIALAAFVMIQTISHLHVLITIALGDLRHWSKVSLSCGVLSVALGGACGKWLGMQWVLVGMSASMVPLCGFLVYKVGTRLQVTLKEILVQTRFSFYACMPLILFFGILFFPRSAVTILGTVFILFVYSLVWGIFAWMVGLTQDERCRIMATLKKYAS